MRRLCEEYFSLNCKKVKRAAHFQERPFILLFLVSINRLNTSIWKVFQLRHFDVS